MGKPDFILTVRFYRTDNGSEPVREWLRSLPLDSKKIIGEDIKTVQYGWPIGMPVVRKLEPGIWEVRSRLKDGISRVLFTVADDTMILLHGFIKKSQKTPIDDLVTARKRKNML
jgi:phage-related protein